MADCGKSAPSGGHHNFNFLWSDKKRKNEEQDHCITTLETDQMFATSLGSLFRNHFGGGFMDCIPPCSSSNRTAFQFAEEGAPISINSLFTIQICTLSPYFSCLLLLRNKLDMVPLTVIGRESGKFLLGKVHRCWDKQIAIYLLFLINPS